jgi:hypothetical protein
MPTREERRLMRHGRKHDRLWDSSDEDSSSEEDFAFLDNIANGKANMTEMEAKLIQGVISAPLKDKKRFDKKRLQAQDDNLSFHSSDEELELDKKAEQEEFEELR